MHVLRPKRPPWLWVSLAVAGASLGLFLALAAAKPWSPGREAGLAFGIAASVLFVIEILYPFRRRLLGFPFGNAQRWIQFHIYGGCLACLFVLIHEGFRWPSGTMGWLLLLLSFWAAASGLVGVWLQKWIPALVSSGLQVELLFERIPELLANLQQEAERLVGGSSEMLERFYSEDVRPALAGVHPSWNYLLDVRSGRDRRLAPFGRLTPFLVTEERQRLDDLKAIFTEKLELDAQYSLQRILRLWSVIHVPASVLLVGLMLFHIWASLYYLS